MGHAEISEQSGAVVTKNERNLMKPAYSCMSFVGSHKVEKIANTLGCNLLGDEDKCVITQEIHDDEKIGISLFLYAKGFLKKVNDNFQRKESFILEMKKLEEVLTFQFQPSRLEHVAETFGFSSRKTREVIKGLIKCLFY